MKYILVLLLICFGVIAMGQVTASVSTSPVSAAVVSAATTPPLTVWGWVKANLGTVAFFAYWGVDLLIYLIPSLAGSGILSQIEIWLKGQATPPTIS